jgi:hypothetical protein
MAKSSSAAPASSGGKKWLKILGIGAGALLLLALAAPLFIPWDKLKDQATAFASQKLGRKLTIEKVEVSLFTGVHLVNVSLANGQGFGKEPLFSNADAKVNLSFLSLLTGKVFINAIEFKQPRIVLEKNEDGVYNFSGLGESKDTPKPAAVKGGDAASGELPITVAALVIKDGSIVYRDLAKKSETAVNGLDIKLLGFSLKSGGDQRLEVKFTAEVEGKKIPLELVSNFKLDVPGESLALKSFDLSLPSVKVSASGDIKGFKSPAVDLKTAVRVALGSVAKDLLPASMAPKDFSAEGDITLDLAVKGAVAQLEDMALSGALTFDKVGAKSGDYPAVKNLQGKLSFDKAGADLPALSMDLGGSPATLAFNAKWGNLDNLKAMKIAATYKLTSPKLVLDPFLAIALADDTPEQLAAKAETARKTGGIQELNKSVPKGLSVKGSIEAESMVARKLVLGAFKNSFALSQQKAQSASDLQLYGGKFWERTNIDMTVPGPTFKTQAAMDSVKFEGLVDDALVSMPDSEKLKDLKGKVFGLFSFKLDATGKGFKNPARMKNLKADGQFSMRDGKILKTEWQEKAAQAIPHPQTQEALRKDIVFQNARGDFSLASNRFTLKNFALGSGQDWRGGEILLQASGAMELGGALDFKIVPHFSPASVKLEGELAQGFNDNAGWPTYDYIAYYGPSSKEAKADFSAGLKKAGRQVIDKKVDEAKQKAQEELRKQAEEKGGEVLKNLPGGLKGIFGQ